MSMKLEVAGHAWPEYLVQDPTAICEVEEATDIRIIGYDILKEDGLLD